MQLLDEIIQILIGMTEEERARVKAFILGNLNLITPIAEISISVCPICESKHIIKYGKKYGKQRYKCKDCNKLFTDSTNTVMQKSKYGLKTWSNYVSSMLAGMSCRDAGKVCNISHKTAFYWRHKILGSLSEVLKDTTTLSGIVESDETFFPVSYKGNHKNSTNFVMPRKARHRGSEIKKRGISNEQVCVSCMTNQVEYQAEIAGLGKITKKQLDSLNKVQSGAILITDKASAYKKYALDHGFDLIQLKSGKEYKRGMYSLAHINAFHSTLKRFLRPFNGVSTKHLGNYLTWHIWLLKTASMMFEARATNMLNQTIHHKFTLTQTGIHQKDALPMVA